MPLNTDTGEPSCDICGKGPTDGPRGHWTGTDDGHAVHNACLICLLRWVVARRALGTLPAGIINSTDSVGRHRG